MTHRMDYRVYSRRTTIPLHGRGTNYFKLSKTTTSLCLRFQRKIYIFVKFTVAGLCTHYQLPLICICCLRAINFTTRVWLEHIKSNIKSCPRHSYSIHMLHNNIQQVPEWTKRSRSNNLFAGYFASDLTGKSTYVIKVIEAELKCCRWLRAERLVKYNLKVPVSTSSGN